jgi:hypothetical protein
MKAMFVRLLLPLAAAAICCAPARAAPGATIDLTGLHLQLTSTIDGSALPLSFRFVGYNMLARVYTDQTMQQDQVDASVFRPVAGHAALGPGQASITLGDDFGDMHVAVGFSAATPEWSTADVLFHTNGEFTLPAHSALTISGHFSLVLGDDWQRNHGYYVLGLTGATSAVSDGRFLYEGVDPEATDFSITATNGGDAPATVYQYSDTYAVAYSNVAAPVPVPEPPARAMLGAGILLVAGMCARRKRQGGRGRPA